ncbi:Beta-4C adrenergic receptor [Trichoplax sp. H2]|nr:Beta-4C adrenergic receptor [Trichoplax sp. H2]|eukprot:RDD44706.1 Beta-4C adrenergic receptor [Trichoplax sp. H2]
MEQNSNGSIKAYQNNLIQSNHTNETAAYFVNLVATITYLAIIIIIGIIYNVINLSTIYKTVILHNYSNVLIANLAIVDLMTITIVLPMAISITILKTEVPSWICQAFGFLSQFLDSVSICNNAAISIDRFIAVTLPYYYQKHMTFTILKCEIVILWLIPIQIGILPLIKMKNFQLGQFEYIYRSTQCWINFRQSYNTIIALIILISMTLMLTIIITCYIFIFVVAYGKNIKNPPNIRNLKKSIRTTILIVGANIVCWIPILITCWFSFLRPQIDYPDNIDKMSSMLCYTHAAFNPVIYCTTNHILRNKLKRIANKRTAIFPAVPLRITPASSRHIERDLIFQNSIVLIDT